MATEAPPATTEEKEPVTPPAEDEPKKTPEGQPEAPNEDQPPAEEPTPEGEPKEKSAAELQAELEAAQEENRKLKEAQKPAEKEKPKAEPAAGGIQYVNLEGFITKKMPEIKKEFQKAEGPEEQLEVVLGMVDQYTTAIVKDRIDPFLLGIMNENIQLSNEVEILNLARQNAEFKNHETTIREELAKLPIKEREKSGVVAGLFERIVGKKALGKKPETPPTKPPIKPAPGLRDAAISNGGKPAAQASGAGIVRLTTDQEKERQVMEEESGYPVSKEDYAAKLKARQDTAKATGKKKIPQTLREIV